MIRTLLETRPGQTIASILFLVLVFTIVGVALQPRYDEVRGEQIDALMSEEVERTSNLGSVAEEMRWISEQLK